MLKQFIRTQLLLGKNAIKKLNNSRVIIFGVGGVGGHVVEALVRSGIGAIDIVDNDTICLTNLNRQILATHNTIGKDKVDVAEERIREINPTCNVTKFKLFYLPETSDQINLSKYDYIIDAIDTVSGKIEIIKKAQECNVPIISCMGAGNKLDPTAFEISDIYQTSVCPLAKVIRKLCRENNIEKLKVVYSKESPRALIDEGLNPEKKPPGSTAFMPAVAGLIIASEVIKDITGNN